EHALDRAVEVARLLIGKIVHDRVAELQVLGRAQPVQIGDADRQHERLASALDADFDLLPDAVVENGGDRIEFGDVVTVERHHDVPDLQGAVGRRAGQHFAHHQHADAVAELAAYRRFRLFPEPQT